LASWAHSCHKLVLCGAAPILKSCADTAAVLDHGSHIFVWLGASLPVAAAPAAAGGAGAGALWTRASAEAACQRLLAVLAEGRFPVPECRTVLEVRLSSAFRIPGS